MEVSVIIPVYNAAPFIEKAVHSALQLEEVKEVLLIEDGSPDNALEICQKLEKEHERVKLFQHPDKKNHGASASRNVGLKHASCNFIAFLDADDFFLPNRFEVDKKIFNENPDADGVYNAIGVHYYSDQAEKLFSEHFENSLTTVKVEAKPSGVFEGLLGFKNDKVDFGYFSLDGLTTKKSALEKMNAFFSEHLDFHEDTDFIIRLSYYLHLFPGSLKEAVTLRGVHDSNRITNLRTDRKLNFHNQKLFWQSVYDWAKIEVKEEMVVEAIKRKYFVTVILAAKKIEKWPKYFSYCLKDKNMITKAKYYDPIHLSLFGEGKFGLISLKIKYKIQNMLGVSWKGF